MQTQVQKWGNSLGLRLPKAFAKEVQIDQGTVVEITVAEGKIIITPTPKPKYQLAALLAGVKKKNLHQEEESPSRSRHPPLSRERGLVR